MIDYSLYLVTDRGLSKGRLTSEIASAAISGGVTCVQLREKHCATRTFIAEARALRSVLGASNIPLIINDRVDVAMAVGAQGVHLGKRDMDILDARRIVGRSMVIGVSAESYEEAVQAEEDGADYIGISPVFATSTKSDLGTPLGLKGVRRIRQSVAIPLVGIGGINAGNAAKVVGAGADGVAVVSAIVSAQCPETAARKLKQQVALRVRAGERNDRAS